MEPYIEYLPFLELGIGRIQSGLGRVQFIIRDHGLFLTRKLEEYEFKKLQTQKCC